MIRVLLVDDHAVVRTGFRLLLQAQREISVRLAANVPAGRHVFTLQSDGDASDAFFVVDVE